jgi:hypothetical protein
VLTFAEALLALVGVRAVWRGLARLGRAMSGRMGRRVTAPAAAAGD